MPFSREEVVTRLRGGVCRIKYTKVSGEASTMLATLQEGAIPQTNSTQSSSSDSQVVTVYNPEKEGWRSFRPENVISIEAA